MAEGSDPLYVNFRTGNPEKIQAGGIDTSVVVTSMIATDAITTVKIADDAVTNAKLANMPAQTFKANASVGAENPQDLTLAQVISLLGIVAGLATINIQAFTTAGTHIYTPTTNTVAALVISTGAGGGGGGCDSDGTSAAGASGGGPGATCIDLVLAASLTATVTVSVGAAGAGGAVTGGNGVDGGATIFGVSVPYHTANGGPGGIGVAGTGNQHFADAVGGATATGALINIQGGYSEDGDSNGGGAAITTARSGNGGGSFWGAGGRGFSIAAATTQGGTANVPGCGGGGGVNINTAAGVLGGDGAPGICVVIEFIGG